MKKKRYNCPCCGALSLDEENSFNICSLCNWEDDPLQKEKPNLGGGANIMSLKEAKKFFNEEILYQELIGHDHYCPLFDEKIADGLCYEIIMVTAKVLAFGAVPEICRFERDEVCLICNSCPINKAMDE